ncbi:hypothetical protein J6U76_03375 [bacterium]|nr:hypothetical protein [bacterium]
MKKILLLTAVLSISVIMTACQKKICDLSREEAKEWTRSATVAEMNQKVKALTEAEKEKLVRSLLVLNIPEEDKETVIKGCAAILSHPKLGFYVELFAHTPVNKHEAGGGAWAAGDHISLSSGLLAEKNPESIRDTLTHELFHIFNDREHGAGGISALNEGTAIWIFNMTFYENDPQKMALGLAEPAIGTKLYYRDIGIPGYPTDIEFGVPTDLTPKGKEVYDMLMAADRSKLPVYDEAKMKEYFEFFSDIDRDQDFQTYLGQFSERLDKWLQTH